MCAMVGRRGLLGHDLLFVEVGCVYGWGSVEAEGATEAEVKRGASSYRCLAAHRAVYGRTAGSIVRVREVAQFGSCGSPFCSSQNQGAVGEPIAGLRGFSARPVGKRGVQSGIFEDEQELLPGRLPNRLPALGGRPIQQSGKVSDTYWTYLLEPTTLSPY